MGKVGRPATSGTRKGNGAGWGGPAKPNRVIPSIQNHPPFEKGNTMATGVMGERKARMQAKAYDVLEAAMDDEDARVRVNAADKALDRIEGKPLARNVNMDADEYERLNDRELADEQARIDAALAAAEARDIESGGAEKPGDVVH